MPPKAAVGDTSDILDELLEAIKANGNLTRDDRDRLMLLRRVVIQQFDGVFPVLGRQDIEPDRAAAAGYVLEELGVSRR